VGDDLRVVLAWETRGIRHRRGQITLPAQSAAVLAPA
jgi:hypothetical protein